MHHPDHPDPGPAARPALVTLIQRFGSALNLNIHSARLRRLRRCQVRVIACLEAPLVIGKILAHLATRRPVLVGEERRPEVRGPPQGTLALG